MNEIDRLIENIENNQDVDYMSFIVNDRPSIKTHFGFWTEYVTLEALERVASLTSDKLYHEHVTNYIYTYPQLFNIKWLDTDPCLNGRDDIRLTIDTREDFDCIKEIYSNLLLLGNQYDLSTVVDFIDRSAHLKEKMVLEIAKNIK